MMKTGTYGRFTPTAAKRGLVVACGILLGELAIAAPAFAQVNPRPSIFSEPPYNHTPRSITPPLPPIESPIPNSRTEPSPPSSTNEPEDIPETTIAPVNGTVSVTLNNQTAANISYQVIGDTQFRTLAGRSQISLQSLRLPMTLTFRREDGGLLQPVLLPGSTAGTLDLNLSEATDLSVDRLTLVVDQAGQVFLR